MAELGNLAKVLEHWRSDPLTHASELIASLEADNRRLQGSVTYALPIIQLAIDALDANGDQFLASVLRTQHERLHATAALAAERNA